LKKKILGITLARAGSKSVKLKNIKLINKKPLIAYTISEALKSKYLTDYIVSTNSLKIAKIAKRYGAKIPFLRPNKLSTDKSSSVSALIHATKFMEKKNKIKYDYIVELMCTNPFKNSIDIDKVIKKITLTKADSVIAVHRIYDHHPARVKKIIDDKICDFCTKEKKESRRQDLRPKAYVRSGAIYALERDYLINEKARYGSGNSRPYFLSENKSVNIDNYIDFYIAEKILSHKKK
jgi:CMP-N-acetylneuraminic acid synthetase